MFRVTVSQSGHDVSHWTSSCLAQKTNRMWNWVVLQASQRGLAASGGVYGPQTSGCH